MNTVVYSQKLQTAHRLVFHRPDTVMTEEPLTITQFTDPLCAWSWNAETTLQLLREHYRNHISVVFVMGGLTDTDDCDFSSNVASHWQTAASQYGMPINVEKWNSVPQHSSYLASVAYKAAQILDETLADCYLRRLREVIATEHRDIEQQTVLVHLATETGYDSDQFQSVLTSETAHEQLQQDLDRTQDHGVTAFPTYQISGPEKSIQIVGDRPAKDFMEAVTTVAPSLQATSLRPLKAFVEHYKRVTTREVAEVYDISVPKAEQALEALRDDGRIQRIEREPGAFWYYTD